MEIVVLDKDYEMTGIVDNFTSLIWTDRYNSYGDFELYLPASTEILELCKQDYYVYLKNSEHLMIIEDVRIESDSEKGTYITVSGRSLESILYRRAIPNSTELSGDVPTVIRTLLDQNVVSPSVEARKISNFIVETTEDTTINGLTLGKSEYTGNNLYDSIVSICEEKGIGFKIILNSSKQLVFSLYFGTDRSYEQTNYPYVIFSPDFDNIISSDYLNSTIDYKNVAIVYGEGDASNRKIVYVGEETELDRREVIVDASSDVENTGSSSEYNRKLKQKGYEELSQNKIKKTVEGEIDSTRMFVYNEDFFVGDIIELKNEYDVSGRFRITEIVLSEDESGITVYPTFNYVDNFEIVKQPESVSVSSGTVTSFYVLATGNGLSYQWYMQANSSSEPTAISNNDSAKLEEFEFTASSTYNGYLFYCVVTESNGNTLTSDAVTLTIR